MKKVNLGDEYTVEFIANRNNGKPVALINRMISFISKTDKEDIKVGESWIVRVDEIKEKCLIITPLTIVKTSEQMESIKSDMISKLPFQKAKNQRNRKPKFKSNW